MWPVGSREHESLGWEREGVAHQLQLWDQRVLLGRGMAAAPHLPAPVSDVARLVAGGPGTVGPPRHGIDKGPGQCELGERPDGVELVQVNDLLAEQGLGAELGKL